jgi:hypothetical protein
MTSRAWIVSTGCFAGAWLLACQRASAHYDRTTLLEKRNAECAEERREFADRAVRCGERLYKLQPDEFGNRTENRLS